jgi:hypothetical protein
VDIALSVLGLVALVSTALVLPGSLRSMRAGDEEWRARWRRLAPDRRRSILRTMRRGEPVRDRLDAELAIRAVAQLDHVRRALRPLHATYVPLLVAMVVIGLAGGWTGLAVIAGAGLAASALLAGIARQRRRRLQESVERTRALL